MKKYILIFGLLFFLVTFCLFFPTKKKEIPSYLFDVSVAGPVKMADGIGRQTVYFMDTLYGTVSMQYFATKSPEDFTDVPENILPFLQKKETEILGKVLIYQGAIDSLPNPGERPNRCLKRIEEKCESQIRIAYSMFESSRIPEHAAAYFNKHFDAIVVPDDFLIEMYQLSGVNIPIFVLPLGLHLEPFLQQPIKKTTNKPFCFVNTSSFIARKNHIGLIRAFHKAFNNDPHVQLCLNGRVNVGSCLSEIDDLIDELGIWNVRATCRSLNSAQYLQFLLKGDVFVTLSKGEGFSIPPREAMALGLPVIISDNTAHKTILQSQLACGISCPSVANAFSVLGQFPIGEEWIADIDEAAHAMRSIYENYEACLLQAEQRREWAKQYCYQNLQSLCLNLVKPKKVILSNKNEITAEGLFTSSEKLYNKYLKVIFNTL